MKQYGAWMQRSGRGLAAALVMAGLSAGSARAATNVFSAFSRPAVTTNAPVNVTADDLQSDFDTGWIEGSGHVVVRRATEELRADQLRYNSHTGDAEAKGRVIFTRPEGVWQGSNLVYNFKTGAGTADRMLINSTPFRVVDSTHAQRTTNGLFKVTNGCITTCTNQHPNCHFHLRARELELEPEKSFTARSVTWYLGDVPVMHLPYWHRDLRNRFGYRVYPGYNSRMGAFLLNSYQFPVNDNLSARTHVDIRTRRGVGLGQDFLWDADGDGSLSLYYIDDQHPIDSDEDVATSDIEPQRYRIKFQQDHRITDRDYVLMRAQYLSDTDMLEDFFEREYRAEAEPDNHIQYTHRGDGYVGGVLIRKQLNDFYDVVERLPEFSLNVMRQEVDDSAIYYEGQNAAGFLRKRWTEDEHMADYDTFRFDTLHMLYRPARYWGFLMVIPRAGYRGTYYSTTADVQNPATLVLQTNRIIRADGRQDVVIQSSPGTNTVIRDGAAAFRSRVEVGMETSFKAYKPWDNVNGEFRHVVEPYANYTLTSDPNVKPEELYQFDDVDQLSREHWVRLGVRNRIQEKRVSGPFDLIDADLYTVLKIYRQNGEKPIENIFFDIDVVPASWLTLTFDGWWNLEQSEFERFNTRATFKGLSWMQLSTEYRMTAGSSSLLTTDLTLVPSHPWSYNLYGRYEFEQSRFEEEACYVQRTFDCLATRLGVSHEPGYTRDDGTRRNDDWRVVFALWLTAFPETGLNTRHMR